VKEVDHNYEDFTENGIAAAHVTLGYLQSWVPPLSPGRGAMPGEQRRQPVTRFQ